LCMYNSLCQPRTPGGVINGLPPQAVVRRSLSPLPCRLYMYNRGRPERDDRRFWAITPCPPALDRSPFTRAPVAVPADVEWKCELYMYNSDKLDEPSSPAPLWDDCDLALFRTLAALPDHSSADGRADLYMHNSHA
jgi:hypothetical protein